jgi:hypothetical protein
VALARQALRKNSVLTAAGFRAYQAAAVRAFEEVTMSVPQESLSSILSNKEPVEVAAPEPTGDTTTKVETAPPADGKTEKVDDKPAQVRDGNGKFAKTEAATAATTEATTETPAAKSEVGAIIAMRQRLQAAENRVKQLEGGDKVAKPSVLDDEDKAFSTRIDEGTRGLREQNYHLSVKLARMEHGTDFGAAEEAFANAAEHDDQLIAALRASADPGEYIYTVGLQIKELADVGGDFVKYREKVTAESRTQLAEKDTRIKALEAENAELKKQKTDLETLPRSLNSRTSATPAAGSEDPEDLKSIVKFGNQHR